MEKTVIIRKIVVAIMTVLIIAYIVSVVLKANFTQIKTETANVLTVSETIGVNGYFVRDEELITYNGGGFVSMALTDGNKVSKNEPVANVFSSAGIAGDKLRIEELDAELERLEQLDKTAVTLNATPDELDKNIDSLLSQINLSLSDGDIQKADSKAETMLYTINERQLVTGKVARFSERIKELRSQISSLKKGLDSSDKPTQILAPATGYFANKADGYENLLTSEDLPKLQVGDLGSDKQVRKTVNSNVIGKVMKGVYWYIACEVNGEEALRIKNAKELSVQIPQVNSENIPVELDAINQKTKTSDAVVILKGTYMNEEMPSVRIENVAIVLKEYTGIYVSKNAVHECSIKEKQKDKDGNEKEVTLTVKGVYIRIGNELLFKQIVPLYTGSDYVICKQNPTDEELVSKKTGILKAYDDVVVEGANLYDGKIIDRTA